VRNERGAGVRYRNEVLPERYVARAGETTREPLDGPTLMRERIMLGLRMEGGIDLDEAAEDLGTAGWTEERDRAAGWLVERGRVVREAGRVRVPRAAWLWTDDTAARLF
jgi:oxygen-independent coproporphyrinogen-3 oxidase